MEYPKIHSYYKRDPETHKFTYEVSKLEFSSIPYWRCEEKIDGMNIRVLFKKLDERTSIDVRGRTDDAMIPPKLLAYFKEKEPSLLEAAQSFSKNFILFGEGFGAGIQKGGIYRKDQAFILFDVYMNQRWGTWQEIDDMATKMGFERPAYLGTMTKDEVIEYLESKPTSQYMHAREDAPMEGIIARSEPLMRFNAGACPRASSGGDPVMWKLKVKDLV